MIELRNYQIESIKNIRSQFTKGDNAVIMQGATGSG